MDLKLKNSLTAHLEHHFKHWAHKEPSSATTSKVSYGTAGFRGRADRIEHIFYNIGLISALKCLHSEASIGLMITASHNPVQDNGVKIISSNGHMLEPDWEEIVEEFCNTHDKNQLLIQINNLIENFNIDMTKKAKGQIIIGMDTRPSSEGLVGLIKQGLNAFSQIVEYIDYGFVTTPAIHYLVAESNNRSLKNLPLQTYYDQLTSGLAHIFERPKSTKSYSHDHLVVDCSNGVGSETMAALCKNEQFVKCLPVKLINNYNGTINYLCGADYIKTTQLPPIDANDISKRYASLDGDADRVVYFYLDQIEPGKFKLNLLDGDKIMTLYAMYISDILKKNHLEGELSLGLVQTAYANGASTDYLVEILKLNVDCVETGVKNLHRQAMKYDISVYFEANGHGTIWISPKAKSVIENGGENLSELRMLLAIINNYTGDAISDILVAETILRHYDWDVKRWYNLYQDKPNSLIKVEVQDKRCIKTTNADRTCPALQPTIDSIVANFGPKARCFVRPSGTEDVVRVYAEADDCDAAYRLAAKVGEQVVRFCNKSEG